MLDFTMIFPQDIITVPDTGLWAWAYKGLKSLKINLIKSTRQAACVVFTDNWEENYRDTVCYI